MYVPNFDFSLLLLLWLLHILFHIKLSALDNCLFLSYRLVFEEENKIYICIQLKTVTKDVVRTKN